MEDEHLVAVGIKAALEQAGHQAACGYSLRQAMSLLDEFKPQAVICDLNLPDGSGWDLLRALANGHKPQAGPPVTVIVLSGLAQAPQMSVPPDVPPPWAVLEKPVERRVLLDCLARGLQASGA